MLLGLGVVAIILSADRPAAKVDVYHSVSGVRFVPILKKKHLLSSAAGL